MFVVARAGQTEFLLCNDRRWRSFLHWGSSLGCVKEFKCIGWALRAARHIGGEVFDYKYWLANHTKGDYNELEVCADTEC